MAIVEELKKEHEVLVNALGTIDSSKIGTEEGNKALFGIKEALLAHLAHEDSDFYPDMKVAAQSYEHIKKMLDDFETDMKKITVVVMDFFDKYTTQSRGSTFEDDFGTLVASLKQRILMEEEVLFKTYEEINSKN